MPDKVLSVQIGEDGKVTKSGEQAITDFLEKNLPPRPESLGRRVVCAAIKNHKGEIICGARHYDEIMRHQLKQVVENNENWDNMQDITQGFIDQWGNFMDRVEAKEVAVAAGQILRSCGGDSVQLFSENLY